MDLSFASEKHQGFFSRIRVVVFLGGERGGGLGFWFRGEARGGLPATRAGGVQRDFEFLVVFVVVVLVRLAHKSDVEFYCLDPLVESGR